MCIVTINRKINTDYRYGFNGMEKDDEVNGVTGSSYTAEYWQYDSRLGRRWNIDPVVKEMESPFATFRGNPIWFNDPNGDDPEDPTVFADEDGNALVDVKDGSDEVFIVKDEKRKEFSEEILNLVKNPEEATVEKSKEIGEKVGVNLAEYLQKSGLSAFEGKDINSLNFRIGFDTGFNPDPSKGINSSLGIGKGGGTFPSGVAYGHRFREAGKLNPFLKIIGSPLIEITPPK